MDFYTIIGLIICGLLFYFWFKSEQKKKEELLEQIRQKQIRDEEIRKGHYDYIMQRIEKIRLGTAEFSRYLENESGYFNNYRLVSWCDNYSYLVNGIKSCPFEFIRLNDNDVEIIKRFIYFDTNKSTLRTEFNKKFIPNELQQYKKFFKNVEKHGLDKDQQIAVVTDEDNNIVIAGAGSGKTTTIVGKVNYVIDKYKVSPKEILLISFTNKSASTLAERINFEGIEVKTFHKFGIDVVTAVEKKKPSIFDEQQFKQLLTKFFKEQTENEGYLQKVTTYFTHFLKPEIPQDNFENQGKYFQYLKDQNFKSYKTKEIYHNGKYTLKMEVVKSIEECKIANFLLFNGVNYEYELPYKYDTATQAFKQYRPDFTINPKSDTVYLEHFALNKNGDVPHFFADSKKRQTIEQATKIYNDGIEWKRNLHHSNSTSLIETYSHEMFDGILFENLTKRLSENGVQLFPKTPEEIWKIISESAKDEVNSFITLFQTFITLMKSNNYKIIDIIKKNKSVKDEFQQKRNALFIEIITPIFDKYELYLKERGEIDFSDMINKASIYIANKKFSKKFSYVIIDEFQDISIGRYQLLRAIKQVNPSCKLFCVGDDWQSIYRFSGSDIALFKNFENYFGHTVKSKIETTYRFHNPLINLSSEFILKNPNQAPKELKSTSLSKSTKHKIVYSNSDNQDDTFALSQILDEILETNDYLKKDIYILGRYSFDIDRIKNATKIFQIDIENGIIQYSQTNEDGETKTIKAHFMTVHKAKGLEAEIVIVINCNSGKHGFPSEMSDDAVLNLLLSEADQFENGEERRLFYVAMTRAKEMVYFIADSSYKSKFIAELEIESGDSTLKKCPKCITADLVKRSGIKNDKPWAFYGCTNFMYGCTHQEWV
ncbi:UvrD-helicase domain-containing protein [Cellulophaga sp. BC115SP]|uniref:UvrD-helicase domain-containing protein n=1 Tax=Cellulophaga sp. BC115SP TaxID=2683263 RepID=UPI0014130A16|nr:UvrD-helicase domain-containing protein [Cellulophaga sp. BC115SP]NBB31371.1 UvrD-helicase domain-containing protein [Cellulophaga sp. BC115SP]